MYEFVADQVFGINGLVNLSNIVFLVAYSARDVLKLRVLSLIGEAVILPYYYWQTEKLWPPIYWGVAFMIVNAVRIVATLLERQPVVLSDKEEQLYRVAFGSIDKRDFLSATPKSGTNSWLLAWPVTAGRRKTPEGKRNAGRAWTLRLRTL
jgi:hypothetical protein